MCGFADWHKSVYPNENDAMNEVLDLQRDLHAKDFALCEEYTFRNRTLFFAFLFSSERVALRSMLPPFDTVTFRVGVVAVRMRFRVTHGIGGFTRISTFLAF